LTAAVFHFSRRHSITEIAYLVSQVGRTFKIKFSGCLKHVSFKLFKQLGLFLGRFFRVANG
jgi:hypothetical protein